MFVPETEPSWLYSFPMNLAAIVHLIAGIAVFALIATLAIGWWRAKIAATKAKAGQEKAEAMLAIVSQNHDQLRHQFQQLTSLTDELKGQFRAVANEALLNQQRQANEDANIRFKQSEQMFLPIRETLALMNEKLSQAESQRSQEAAKLATQLENFTKTGAELNQQTKSLHDALAKPKVRGAWGELQLEKIVEASGMVAHCAFETQQTYTDSAGAHRPDMTIFLSGQKQIFVDSKVPLAAFLEFQALEDPKQADQALTRFINHVKTHIDNLSSKNYWTLTTQSPEFVVLFVPSDALLIDALGAQPDLFEYASAKNIVLASPSTLITLLKTAAFTWRQQNLELNAGEVLKLGRELYARLATMANHFDKLGKSLTNAVTSYNSTLGALESRVLVTGRKIQQLGLSDTPLASNDPIVTATRSLTAGEFDSEPPLPDTQY